MYICVCVCVFSIKTNEDSHFFLFTIHPYPLAYLIILRILNNQENLLSNKQTDGHVFLFCFWVLVLGIFFIICKTTLKLSQSLNLPPS